jgi:hypothetical protein
MLTTIEIDEDLSRLELDIRQLKIGYEQYFGGGKKRPPNDVEWRIEQLIKRYGDRGAEMNYGQRFRYGNLAQTFAKYREIFHKRLRMREEGTAPRHFGAAARAIEAERKRARQARLAAPTTVTFADPAQEPDKVETLYRAFCNALEGAGESAARLSRKNFEQFLQQKAEQFREQRNGREVEFVVSVESGKARLKARIKS